MSSSRSVLVTRSRAAAWLFEGLGRLRGLPALEASGVGACFGVTLRAVGTPPVHVAALRDGAPVALALREGPKGPLLQSGHCEEPLVLGVEEVKPALGPVRVTDEIVLVRPRDGGPCRPRTERAFEVDLAIGLLRLRGIIQSDGRLRFASFALQGTARP